MDIVRISAASLNQIPLDWVGNRKRIIKLIESARAVAADMICFPELSLSGYNCEDMFLSLHTARQALESLTLLLPYTRDITVVLGLPMYHRGSIYNCASVIQDGKVLGFNPKKVLAREGVHYEARWFRPWPFHDIDTIEIGEKQIPFGDLRYQLGTLQLGIVICEEAWSAESGPLDVDLSACELVVNLSASHFALGKAKIRENLVRDASRTYQSFYLYSNLLGLEAGRQIYDGELLLGAFGSLVGRSQSFCLGEGELLVSDVDLDAARTHKLQFRSVLSAASTMRSPAAQVVRPSLVFQSTKGDIPRAWRGVAERAWQSFETELLQAMKLALLDYVRKARAQGFMLSLSGGCDSSALAVFCAHAIAEGLSELGAEGLSQHLGWQEPAKEAGDPRSWIAERLHTVYQAADQSGEITRKAAAVLATELRAHHHELSLSPMVGAYQAEAERWLGRPLTWEQDDLALQNIQARARAPMVWLMANLRGLLLLATSNRSEVAVGYATMDGDTAGGLAPLAGIDKHHLRSWLRWAERDCPLGLGPLASLSFVNAQEPTAELRPAAANQTDERDLMPYEILNTIETAFVRDRMDPTSIRLRLIQLFPSYSREQLTGFIQRFFLLWSQNQWKRERYAPGFHLDDYSLDAKTWCRFPIFSHPLSPDEEASDLGIRDKK